MNRLIRFLPILLGCASSVFAEDPNMAAYQFFTPRSSEDILNLVNPKFPEASVMVSSSAYGTRVQVHCTFEEGLKIRDLVETNLGTESVNDWVNQTPREWKSEAGRQLFAMKNPGHPLPALRPELLLKLNAEERASIANDLTYFLQNLWSRGMFGREWQLHQAIRALGFLNNSNSVPILIERLEFTPENSKVRSDIPNELNYPAAVALARLAGKAKEPVLEVLSDPSMTKQRLAAWVLFQSLGQEAAGIAIKEYSQKGSIPREATEKFEVMLQEYSTKWGVRGLDLTSYPEY